MTSKSMSMALSVLGPCVDRGSVMILGELCNFAGAYTPILSFISVSNDFATAYAFVEAIVVVRTIS